MIFGFFKGDDAYEALREVRREAVAALEQVPWEHAQTDDSSNVSTSADVLGRATNEHGCMAK